MATDPEPELGFSPGTKNKLTLIIIAMVVAGCITPVVLGTAIIIPAMRQKEFAEYKLTMVESLQSLGFGSSIRNYLAENGKFPDQFATDEDLTKVVRPGTPRPAIFSDSGDAFPNKNLAGIKVKKDADLSEVVIAFWHPERLQAEAIALYGDGVVKLVSNEQLEEDLATLPEQS
ncbi:MAG: hypothetical protein KDC26_12295 [Armatimonadetes bacterium]|nr:hypothetical protein [Armatimonadota bacterium]